MIKKFEKLTFNSNSNENSHNSSNGAELLGAPLKAGDIKPWVTFNPKMYTDIDQYFDALSKYNTIKEVMNEVTQMEK